MNGFPRILVAGIGNVFHGDDAFGVAVVQKLRGVDLGPNVEVRDFGTRGFDLALALNDRLDTVILVDAVSRGGAAGSLFLIEPDVDRLDEWLSEASSVAHGLHPAAALQLAKRMGARLPRLLLVGCEPANVELAETMMALTEPVRAALDVAVEMIREQCAARQAAAGALCGV